MKKATYMKGGFFIMWSILIKFKMFFCISQHKGAFK
jgi:hypothetical protein